MTVDINQQEDRAYKRAKERVEALRGFYIHLLVYLTVNLGLFAINMLSSPHSLWFYWPLIGWGIGLAVHGMVVFAGGPFGPAWEERKIHELMDEERRHPTPRVG